MSFPKLALAFWAVLFFMGANLHADENHVIPSGYENFFNDLFSQGNPVPHQCRLTDTKVSARRVVANYICADSKERSVHYRIALKHFTAKDKNIISTNKFSITWQSDDTTTAPDDLIAGLVKQIETEERHFKWGKPGDTGGTTKRNIPGRFPQFPLLVVFAAVFLLFLSFNDFTVPRRDLVIFVCIFIAAICVRFLLGAWGPFHPNGQAPLWIGAAFLKTDQLQHYGPGFIELFHLATRLGSPDTGIFAANGIYSALAPAFLFVLCRCYGLNSGKSLVTACLLVADPISIKVACTESYFPSILTLSLIVRILFLLGVEKFHKRQRKNSILLLVAGGLICAQLVRIHPVAWIPAALTITSVLACDGTLTFKQRTIGTAITAVLVAVIIAITSYNELAGVASHVLSKKFSSGSVLGFNDDIHGVLIFAVMILVIGLFMSVRWVVVAALLELIAAFLLHQLYSQNWIYLWTFLRLFLPFIIIGYVAMIPGPIFRYKFTYGVVMGTMTIVVGLSLPMLNTYMTEHYEYHWIRDRIKRLPSNCTIFYIPRVEDRIVYIPEYVSQAKVVRIENVSQTVNHPTPNDCLYWIHSSLCSGADSRQHCTQMQEKIEMKIKDGTVLPAIPTHPHHQPYEDDQVEVSLWRIQ